MGIACISVGLSIVISLNFYHYAMENQAQLVNSNRLFEGFYTIFGDGDVESGTFNFREIMNMGMITEIKNSSLSEIVFGHGASSSEYVARKYHPYQINGPDVDANRVAHNEWLRLFYEFGIVGTLILLYFFLSCINRLFVNKQRIVPIIAYGLGFAVAFSTENVLMGASNVVLCGIVMLLASSVTRKPADKKVEHKKYPYQIEYN